MNRLALVVGALALGGCVQHAAVADLTGDPQASKQLVLTLPEYGSGKPHSLSQDRGSVVLLDVWATWCEPCRDALPVYQDLLKQYGAQGFKVETVNIDEDPKQISAFLQQTGISLPILLDPGGNFSQDTLHVTRMPTTFLIDRKGDVRFVHEGFAEEFLGKYQNEIQQLLAETAS